MSDSAASQKQRAAFDGYTGDMRLTALLAALLPALAHATPPAILCHYSYGGETHEIPVAPSASPYAEPARQIGSFFKLRTVWVQAPEAEAGFHVYVFGDDPDGPILVQQGSFPARNVNQSRYGFTGLQRVYEPRRDGELQYWCEHQGSAP